MRPGGRAVRDVKGLTGLQLAILQVLWERGEASTQDVWAALAAERELAVTTVATLLSRLAGRRIVARRKAGRHYVYRATVSCAEVRRSKVREVTETLFGGDSAALLRQVVQDVDERERQRIRTVLDEAEAAGPGTDP